MASDRSQSFGKLLRHLRLSAELTQEELAEKAGISTRAISDLERNVKLPHKVTAQMLADGLGLEGEERSAFMAARRRQTPDHSPFQDGATQRQVDLPVPPNALLGREREIAAACEMMSKLGVHLLSLTGPGGVGKTRLALEVASRLAERFTRVHFISLAPIDDPALVIPLIGQALDVHEVGESPRFDVLRDVLRDVPSLLVLDNAEHLESAAPELANLLAACPQLTILVTSRAALRIHAEREFPVEPLELPPAGRIDADDLNHYPAMALFIERAHAIAPQFAVTPANALTIAQICHRLDGLPLAIELAAAHAKVLSMQGILHRLERRLDLLARGAQDSPARQQTMRATIGWSYDLLLAPEQSLFRRLAVLANGFTLEAAEAIGNGNDRPDTDILSGLESLVDKSLVRRLDWVGEPRFGMLETIREFGLDELVQAGESETVRRIHADYVTGLVEVIQAHWVDAQQEGSLERLVRENDNVREALAWSLGRDEGERTLRLTGAMARFWYLRGHWSEGRKWLAQALANAQAIPSLAFARSHLGAGVLAEAQGETETARSHYERAQAVFLALDYKPGLCRVLNNLGNVLGGLSQLDEALRQYELALKICHEAGETQGVAQALQNLGIVAALRGQRDVAAPLLQESLALYRRLGDQFGIGSALSNLGSLAFREGNLHRARELCAEALTLTQGLGDPQGEAAALLVLGEVALQRGEFEDAEAYLDEALMRSQDLGDPLGEAMSLAGLGGVAFRGDGDRGLAKRLLRDALERFDQLGEQEQAAWCLDELAHVLVDEKRLEWAAHLLGAAEARRAAINIPLAPVYEAGHDQVMIAVKSALGDRAFRSAAVAGKSMTIAQIIAAAAPD